MLTHFFLSCCKCQDKLLASKTAAEVAIGKSIGADVIPVVEKFHKVRLTGSFLSSVHVLLFHLWYLLVNPFIFVVLYRRKKGY